MNLKIRRLYSDAKMPYRAYEGDAGMDLYVHSANLDWHSGVMTYGSGLALEIPEGYVGLLFPRSSVYKTGMRMCNCVGVIDSGYRGEVMGKFYAGRGSRTYSVGDRFAQLIVMPYPSVEIEEVSELSDSERGTGGHGSSGL